MTIASPTEQEIADALQVDCESCKRLPAEQCWTLLKHTILAKPHIPRLKAGLSWRAGFEAGAVSRQGEVNTVTADLTTALTRNKLLEATHLLDLKTIADLRAQVPTEPEPEPEPPTKRTLFGACILTGGAAGVVAKYGKGAAIRQFQTPLTPVTAPTGSLLHLSAKPALSVTDAQIDAWLKSGGLRTIRHEPDNDGMSAVQIAEWKALSNRVYDRNVALGRPCLIAPTFTGGLWSSNQTDAQRDVWMVGLKGDLLGIDYDGVHDNQTAKPADLTYRVGKREITNADEIANAQRYIERFKANGWTGFTVPEFGISRATWDTDGQGRAKWLRDNAKRFVDAGAYAVHWYDFQDTKTKISDIIAAGSPEHAVLRELVAGNA